MVVQAIAIQIWLGLSLNSPSNLGRSQSSRRAGPMLWDLDQQFPGSIGGSQPASECGFPPFRFWRKKLESGPTDRPTDRQPPCARIKGGEREAQTSSSRSRFPTTPLKVCMLISWHGEENKDILKANLENQIHRTSPRKERKREL